MPVYAKGGHEVNVSGAEAVAQFEAAGYSPVAEKAAEKPKPVKKSEK